MTLLRTPSNHDDLQLSLVSEGFVINQKSPVKFFLIRETIFIRFNLDKPYTHTCAANASTAVHDHWGAPWRSCPAGAQALDRSISPLKDMLTEVQHS